MFSPLPGFETLTIITESQCATNELHSDRLKTKRFPQLRSLELIHDQQHTKYLEVSLKQFFSSQIELSYHKKSARKVFQIYT